jgi:acyl-coenzyme A synthetase/AMP-(fatty) acid ligase
MHDGYLYLLGRNDRVVTISDISIPLDRVEEALRTHPNVMQAAVLTRADKLRGLGLYALVQTRDGTDYIGNIDGYMPSKQMPKIRKLIRISNWPVTAGGKTDYNALQDVLNKHP